jgi:hypothetical protein
MQASARKGIVELKQALRVPLPAVPEISWDRDGGEEALLVHDGLVQPFVTPAAAGSAPRAFGEEDGGTGS